jgi:hypothetical protein
LRRPFRRGSESLSAVFASHFCGDEGSEALAKDVLLGNYPLTVGTPSDTVIVGNRHAQ